MTTIIEKQLNLKNKYREFDELEKKIKYIDLKRNYFTENEWLY